MKAKTEGQIQSFIFLCAKCCHVGQPDFEHWVSDTTVASTPMIKTEQGYFQSISKSSKNKIKTKQDKQKNFLSDSIVLKKNNVHEFDPIHRAKWETRNENRKEYIR